jgi:competence protein ComEA
VLVLLILFFLALPYVFKLFNNNEEFSDTQFNHDLASFEASLKPIHDTSSIANTKKSYSLFRFDPNKVEEDELLQMGLSKQIIHSLVNFRSKGGKFFKTEDLLKLYGVDSATFTLLKPYVFIKKDIKFVTAKLKVQDFYKLEINSADSIALVKLPAIGPKLAHRIINYRKSLGGFYSIDQIKEVYGITDSAFNIIEPHLSADNLLIRTIDLETVTVNELKKHPYINKYESLAIIKYRTLKSNKVDASGLLKDKIISSETYKKLLPYLRNK